MLKKFGGSFTKGGSRRRTLPEGRGNVKNLSGSIFFDLGKSGHW